MKRDIRMPLPALSREAVRDVDRRAIEDYGMAGVVLMENAGRGAAELLEQLGIDGTVVVCAGKGNNGGDGFVIARHLENHGYDCRVLLSCDPSELQGDALINWQILEHARSNVTVCMGEETADSLRAELAAADWVVDALLGTGARGSVREPFDIWIKAMNEANKKVLAVDLPSGLDCDRGEPLLDSGGKGSGPCVQATQTATFVARKLGFENPGSTQWTGPVEVIEIGVPWNLLESLR